MGGGTRPTAGSVDLHRAIPAWAGEPREGRHCRLSGGTIPAWAGESVACTRLPEWSPGVIPTPVGGVRLGRTFPILVGASPRPWGILSPSRRHSQHQGVIPTSVGHFLGWRTLGRMLAVLPMSFRSWRRDSLACSSRSPAGRTSSPGHGLSCLSWSRVCCRRSPVLPPGPGRCLDDEVLGVSCPSWQLCISVLISFPSDVGVLASCPWLDLAGAPWVASGGEVSQGWLAKTHWVCSAIRCQSSSLPSHQA